MTNLKCFAAENVGVYALSVIESSDFLKLKINLAGGVYA